MTEVPTMPFIPTNTMLPLNTSMLYRIFSEIGTPYPDLQPTFQGTLQAEILVDNEFARSDEEGEKLRIFINYVNIHNQTFQQRVVFGGDLDTLSTIDKYVDDYVTNMTEGEFPAGTVWTDGNRNLLPIVLHSIIHSLAIKSMDEETSDPATLVNLGSLITVIFNYPKDVMLHIEEQKGESGGLETKLSYMWVVKKR